MSILLKQAIIVFLASLVVGAVLFCALTGTMNVNLGMDDMPSNHNAPPAHLAHTKELTSTVTTATSLLLTILFLMASFALVFFYGRNLPSEFALSGYFRKKHYDIFPVARLTMHNWLALFERSPNPLRPA